MPKSRSVCLTNSWAPLWPPPLQQVLSSPLYPNTQAAWPFPKHVTYFHVPVTLPVWYFLPGKPFTAPPTTTGRNLLILQGPGNCIDFKFLPFCNMSAHPHILPLHLPLCAFVALCLHSWCVLLLTQQTLIKDLPCIRHCEKGQECKTWIKSSFLISRSSFSSGKNTVISRYI